MNGDFENEDTDHVDLSEVLNDGFLILFYKVKPFAFQNFFAPSQKSMASGRQTLQILQASAGNKDVNRPIQVCSDCH